MYITIKKIFYINNICIKLNINLEKYYISKRIEIENYKSHKFVQVISILRNINNSMVFILVIWLIYC